MAREKHYTFWGMCPWCGSIQPMRPIKEIFKFAPDEFHLIKHRIYWDGPFCEGSEGKHPEYCAEIKSRDNPYITD